MLPAVEELTHSSSQSAQVSPYGVPVVSIPLTLPKYVAFQSLPFVILSVVSHKNKCGSCVQSAIAFLILIRQLAHTAQSDETGVALPIVTQDWFLYKGANSCHN